MKRRSKEVERLDHQVDDVVNMLISSNVVLHAKKKFKNKTRGIFFSVPFTGRRHCHCCCCCCGGALTGVGLLIVEERWAHNL